MTLNDFLQAIADRLRAIWPDKTVQLNKIPRDADGQFFVGIIESGQEKHLDRRRKRTVQFEVLYFLRKGDNLAFNAWAEQMYDSFEVLDVRAGDGTREVRLTGQTARDGQNERVFQFLFDADFFVRQAPEEAPMMETLQQTEAIQ